MGNTVDAPPTEGVLAADRVYQFKADHQQEDTRKSLDHKQHNTAIPTKGNHQ